MSYQYGLGETIKNIISCFYTKLKYPKARLIRLPIYIRRKKYFQMAKGFTTGYGCRIEMFENGSEQKKIIFEENCKIGDYVHIAAAKRIKFGANTLIASHVYISDVQHGKYDDSDECSSPEVVPDKRELYAEEIEIGKNVWIGENVCILPGVKIGDGTIIGANSVVNKNIDAYSIAVGAPAKIVKRYNTKTNKWERV